MKRINKALLLPALALVLLLALAVPAFAADQYIYDTVGLLADSEREALEAAAASVSRRHQCGVYIVTVDDYRSYGAGDVESVGRYLYTSNNFGLFDDQSGILLLLSMDDRDYAVVANGYGTYVTRGGNSSTLDSAFLDNFRYNDWSGGFGDYVDMCDRLLEAADREEYDPYAVYHIGWGPAIGIGVAVGLLAAFIACSAMKAKMRSVAKAAGAAAYMASGVNLVQSDDVFSHVTETRTVIESDSSRGGGGSRPSGGMSSHSGKF